MIWTFTARTRGATVQDSCAAADGRSHDLEFHCEAIEVRDEGLVDMGSCEVVLDQRVRSDILGSSGHGLSRWGTVEGLNAVVILAARLGPHTLATCLKVHGGTFVPVPIPPNPDGVDVSIVSDFASLVRYCSGEIALRDVIGPSGELSGDIAVASAISGILRDGSSPVASRLALADGLVLAGENGFLTEVIERSRAAMRVPMIVTFEDPRMKRTP